MVQSLGFAIVSPRLVPKREKWQCLEDNFKVKLQRFDILQTDGYKLALYQESKQWEHSRKYLFLAQVIQGISNLEQDILVTLLQFSTSFHVISAGALTRMSEARNQQLLPPKSLESRLGSIISNSSRFLSKRLLQLCWN